MQPEKLLGNAVSKKKMLWLSLWSNHNITQPSDKSPAQRINANPKAVEMAYRSGQVFIGYNTLPIIDVRHYLEHELDMHHSSASFVTRIRMQQAMSHYRNQIIWIADKAYSPVNEAFRQMDRWLIHMANYPNVDSWQVKPEFVQDSCFNAQGRVIAAGKGVWDGDWNAKPEGPCHKIFPPFTNSRIAAGGPWQGSMFACRLIPVQQAIKQGVYLPIDMTPYQDKLNAAFPNGVCDFSQPDRYRPVNL